MVQQVFLDPPEISLFPLKDTEMLISLVRHHLTGKLAEEEFYLRVGLIFFFQKKTKQHQPKTDLGYPGCSGRAEAGAARFSPSSTLLYPHFSTSHSSLLLCPCQLKCHSNSQHLYKSLSKASGQFYQCNDLLFYYPACST